MPPQAPHFFWWKKGSKDLFERTKKTSFGAPAFLKKSGQEQSIHEHLFEVGVTFCFTPHSHFLIATQEVQEEEEDESWLKDISTKTKNHFKHILAPLQKPIVTNYQYLGELDKFVNYTTLGANHRVRQLSRCWF